MKAAAKYPIGHFVSNGNLNLKTNRNSVCLIDCF